MRSFAFISWKIAIWPWSAPADDAQPIAALESRTPRQHDQPVVFAGAQIRDDAVRNAGGMFAVHDQLRHAGRAARPVPLQLDADEGVAGEQERRAVRAARFALDADARRVGHIAADLEEMQRELDAPQAGAAPIHGALNGSCAGAERDACLFRPDRVVV